MVAGCHHESIDVWVFDEPTQIVCGFGIGESRFGFGDPTRIGIAQTDDLNTGDFGKAPHEFIGSATATEEAYTDFFVKLFAFGATASPAAPMALKERKRRREDSIRCTAELMWGSERIKVIWYWLFRNYCGWEDTPLAFFVLDEMVLVLEKYRWDSGASSTSSNITCDRGAVVEARW